MRHRDASRRGVTHPEILFLVAVLLGVVAGVTYGALHHGWLGAVAGVPLGALAGFLVQAAFFVVVFAVVWVVMTTCVLFKQGPREAARFFIHGSKLAGMKEPRPPANPEPNV